jgi:serine protease Do
MPTTARIGMVEVGERVLVVGVPVGFSHSLTVGHISGRHVLEDDTLGTVQPETFQTDTAVNQGNSGGPMFNMKAQVVGIVSYTLTQSGERVR